MQVSTYIRKTLYTPFNILKGWKWSVLLQKCYGSIIINKIAFALFIVIISLLCVGFVVANSNEIGNDGDVDVYGSNHVKFESSLLNGHEDSELSNLALHDGGSAMSNNINSHVEGPYSYVL